MQCLRKVSRAEIIHYMVKRFYVEPRSSHWSLFNFHSSKTQLLTKQKYFLLFSQPAVVLQSWLRTFYKHRTESSQFRIINRSTPSWSFLSEQTKQVRDLGIVATRRMRANEQRPGMCPLLGSDPHALGVYSNKIQIARRV